LIDLINLPTSVAASVRVFFVAQRRKMYRELVNRSINFVFPSKTSQYDFLQKSLEVTPCLHDTKTVSSVRVFFAAQRRKMYREPVNRSTNSVCESKTSRYVFLQNLLEVTSCLHDTKTVSSVRVFLLAQHRKMYREPVNGSTNFVFNQKLLDKIFSQKSLEVTSCLHDTKTVSSVRVFFVAQRRKMYREPVKVSTNSVCESKTSRYDFFTKITRSDDLFTRYENGFVSSSVFRSAA